MTRCEIRLVEPSEALRVSWWEAAQEFGDEHRHGFSLHRFEDVDLTTDTGFASWMAQMRRNRTAPAEGLVPATLFWIVDADEPGRVLGSLQLRHELNAYLLEEGGHIGYGVRPSARGRGVATAALAASVEYAGRDLGLDRVLVTCDDDNAPSRRTIERCGGVLEDVRGDKRRYWIACAA